ncbi:MAG TPA: sulfite exporter TauE/SafE family protein, partial [Phycisphaerae bacterium]|nr:sulfite exporter TauE/SafE family protein [Phycisphaerae bacterium]
MISSVLLAILIFLVAALYSTVGHAGASGYLACMALFGLAPEVMRPAALTLNILVATIGTIRFARAGCFSRRIFLPFAITSVPCAYFGGRYQLSAQTYHYILGVVLLFASLQLFRKAVSSQSLPTKPPSLTVALPVGAALGYLSGLTGVGGGIFLSPILLLMCWASPQTTAGVSAAFILVNSLAGLGGAWSDLPHLPGAIALWAVAAIAGGNIGSYLGSRRLTGPAIRRLLADR